MRAWRAMVLRSSLQSRLTVATMFWRVGMMPSTAVMCCCSRVSGAAGVDAWAGGVEGPATGPAAFGWEAVVGFEGKEDWWMAWRGGA